MSASRPKALHGPIDLDPDALALRVGSMPNPAILESGPGFGESGRWGLYTAEPLLRFQARDNAWTTQILAPELKRFIPDAAGVDPLQGLQSLLNKLGLDRPHDPPEDDACPFRGGLIGWFGYDLAPRIERLPRKAGPDSQLPDIAFGLHDAIVAFDHQTQRATLSVHELPGLGPGYLQSRFNHWRRCLERPVPPPRRTVPRTPIVSNMTRSDYHEMVERALEYIRAGDIFQVNLSQRFSTTSAKLDALDLFLRSRQVSPAPFAAFLRWDDARIAVVSASPEWFYQTRGDWIMTRPIKGTRPRGASPEEDARLADELRSSAKDNAELTMIVDLERNDLGRVCRYGTVRVDGPFKIESYAQVHHLVARISGRLRGDRGPIDIVRAMFPGGSITGAPKVRAMEVIDELEPTRRGLYTGAIGYYSFGASAFNIAIRTMLIEGDRVSFQVGGGIVADSVPELEFDETMHKGKGLRAVLEGAGP